MYNWYEGVTLLCAAQYGQVGVVELHYLSPSLLPSPSLSLPPSLPPCPSPSLSLPVPLPPSLPPSFRDRYRGREQGGREGGGKELPFDYLQVSILGSPV